MWNTHFDVDDISVMVPVGGEMEDGRTFVDLSEKRPQQPAREILICSQIMFADRQSLRSVKPRGRSMTPLDATT